MSQSRIYGSKWNKARLTFLQQHPLCVMCRQQGRFTAATVVDHIVPHKLKDAMNTRHSAAIKAAQRLFWDKKNWQSLCASHHNSTKQRIEKRGQDIGCDAQGYGHTKDVKPGQVNTEQQAEAFLHDDLQPIYLTLESAVKVSLTQGQFDALCSFIFNCGAGNFVRSTLLKKLNAGDYQGAADEFQRWNKAAGKVMNGLTKRRASERQMFLS